MPHSITVQPATTMTTEIHDAEGRELLDTIDQIRQLARIPHQLELPQIIVVGQQSSGKSSLLAAISGIPFPSDTGLCTQFAIEIRCRRSYNVQCAAKIVPFGQVSPQKLQRLNAFTIRWAAAKIDTADQVETMIDAARTAMDLQTGSGHSNDRLVIEIEGPLQEHLTIIDLPGLTADESEDQRAQIDALVIRHMRQANTIILAVVWGAWDLVNQRIFNLGQEFWPRTIGVVTAADAIDWEGNGLTTFKNVVSRSGRIRPRYGWHMVRNLKAREIRAGKDRDATENEFFAGKVGAPEWRGLEHVHCGIESLRQKLSKTLKLHISSSLPIMLNLVDSAIKDEKAKLRLMGDERGSTTQQRAYLAKSASSLNARLRSTLDGQVDAFEVVSDGTSLRDTVRSENERFADDMIGKGHTWQVKPESVIDGFQKEDPDYKNDPKEALRRNGPNHLDLYPVSKHALLTYLTQAISRRPGRALRGTFDPMWVGTFFLQQSHKWRAIVEAHAENMFEAVADEVRSSVYTCLTTETADALWEHVFDPSLAKRKENLQAKIEELLAPYTSPYPATLNRGYTRTLLRENKKSKKILHSNGSDEESDDESEDEAHLQYQAAAHIYQCMDSYYAVALNVLLDNVQSLAIENVLLNGLDNILDLESLAEMDENRIAQLAAESPEKADERREIMESIKSFEEAKTLIQRWKTRSLASTSVSTPPRPRMLSKKASRNGTSSPSQSTALSDTRPAQSSNEDIRDDEQNEESIPRHSSSSADPSNQEGERISTKAKGKQPSHRNVADHDDQGDTSVVENSPVQIAQQA